MNWRLILHNWNVFLFHNPLRTIVLVFAVLMLIPASRDYIFGCAVVLGRTALVLAFIWWMIKLAKREFKIK